MSSPVPSILVVIPVSTPWPPMGSGGVQVFVRQFAELAAEQGLRIRILGVGADASRSGTVEFIPIAPAARTEAEFTRCLTRAIARDPGLLPRDAVVLANAEHYVWALRRYPVPVVLVAHGVVSVTLRLRRGVVYAWLFRHIVEASAVRRSARIAVVNSQVEEYYASRYPRVTAGKIVPLSIGVRIEDFAHRPRSQPILPEGLRPDVPIVLFVGRLSPEKNVDLFIRACDELAASRAVFGGLAVGDGPEGPRLRGLQKSRPWLFWLPAVPHAQLLDLMAVARVLLICSSYEGLPTVLLEAIASALPIVSTDVGRSRELLKPPLGMVTDPSPKALAEAARALMTYDRAEVRTASAALSGTIDFRSTTASLVSMLQEVSVRRGTQGP